ncbi:AraC family transcriptional regulator [Paenibacillus sp. IB182496]|uniref:AraC family transcriptional regulator n=1 Tax=Paenibacillus sabuli TaxID=2772509 RepID=A0A927GQU9_9BACL|nr:AraC family transcriptional regulator [Paenibacillus sabuli]MBD2844142.1 AraC family transcriptional regulator [Paenibacillus sabuli]
MRSYLYRLIWLGSISICLPIILASLVYYNTSMKREIVHIQKSNQISLGIIQTYIDNAMFGVVQELTSFAFDPDVFEAFLALDETARIDNNTFILSKISALLQSSEFINEIYFYNMNNDFILSSAQGKIAANQFRFVDDLAHIANDTKSAHWTYLPASEQEGYISFVLTLPAMSLRPQGVLVAQVEVEQFNRYLTTFLTITNNQSIFVRSAAEGSLFQSKQLTSVNEAIAKKMDQDSLNNPSSDNASIKGGGGSEYFYSYQKSNSGLSYVSVTSRSVIVGELRWIMWSTIFAVAIFLTMGIILTIYNSRQAYNPIGQLVDYGKRLRDHSAGTPEEEFSFLRQCLDQFNSEVNSLHVMVAKSEPFLIERFMQHLLKGNYTSRSPLYEDCEQYGVPVDCTYVVLVVRVEDFGKNGRFQSKDKPLLAYAVMNVMNELLEEYRLVKGYVLDDLRGHEIAALCFDPDTPPDAATGEARAYAEGVSAALQNYLNVRVSIGIGRAYPHIGDISLSYRDSMLALQFRLLASTEAIISIDDAPMEKLTLPEYPYETENALIEAMLNEDSPAFKTGIWTFSRLVTEKESYYFIYQSYQVLLSALIANAEKKCGTSLGMLEYDLFDQFRTNETVEEIGLWFIDTIPPLYSKVMKDNNRTAGKAGVKEVCKYIANHISRDISLTECAELAHMNPSYFSRLFKKETGVTFHEYLIKSKINAAVKLLVESDVNISEIAERVGYSHRSFNRIFQQAFQMSPSQYRGLHR